MRRARLAESLTCNAAQCQGTRQRSLALSNSRGSSPPAFTITPQSDSVRQRASFKGQTMSIRLLCEVFLFGTLLVSRVDAVRRVKFVAEIFYGPPVVETQSHKIVTAV